MAQSEASKLNHKVALGVGIADSTNVSIIFAFFLKEVWFEALKETAKFYLFPIAAAGALIETILAARQAKLDQYQNGTLANALIRLAAFIAISVAVLGEVLAGALFSFASPLIFTVTMAVRAVFHFSSAFHFWDKNRQVALGHLAAAAATTLISIAVGLAMLAGQHLVAILGIIGAAVGASYALSQLVKMMRGTATNNAPYEAVRTEEPVTNTDNTEPDSSIKLTVSAQLHKQFAASNAQVTGETQIAGDTQTTTIIPVPETVSPATVATKTVAPTSANAPVFTDGEPEHQSTMVLR